MFTFQTSKGSLIDDPILITGVHRSGTSLIGYLPIAETYYKHCISLPMYPTLTDENQNIVIKKINSFYESK